MEFDTFKSVLESALTDEGLILTNARAELENFYERIQEPFANAVAAGDSTSLAIFRDQAALLIGRASFKVLSHNRQIVMTTALTVLRVLIAIK